jgi:hypothetical protein
VSAGVHRLPPAASPISGIIEGFLVLNDARREGQYQTMPLTDMKTRALKPEAKTRKYADGGNMYLEVKPNGFSQDAAMLHR